ncbi:MAG: U32 family peptidase [Treponema sp.]|jgi:putative protease|nr:U32 family peptidase [Treponema sp.]
MFSIVPELLAPAGSPEALDAACAEGADAVYLGLKSFNARLRSANFSYAQFEGALRSLRRMGKKIYVTVNTVFEEREADRLYQLLKYLAALEPDGIIVQDFGLITLARENFPSLKLFASTQMNIASSRGINLLSRYGFSRVVLARELSLEEIRDLRKNTNVELEVFVHGALCMSVSGLCLFSSFLGGKSANRGMCTQACRRFYYPEGSAEGGYYFSPNDLELIEKIPLLAEAGVNSFKIEGRMKSAEYVGTVVSAYRLVLDSLNSGEDELALAIKNAQIILRNDFARPKTVYLFNGNNSYEWLNPHQTGGTGIPLGKLHKVKVKGEANLGLIAPAKDITGEPLLPNTGDSVRLHRADDTLRESHKITSAEDVRGASRAAGRWIDIPEGFNAGDAIYLIQTKSMTRRYPQIIKGNLDAYKRCPGRDKAPKPKTLGTQKKSAKIKELAEGLYVQVSGIEDLYVLQSDRPVKAILCYNHNQLPRLLLKDKQPLPFIFQDIIIQLDPFFPQDQEAQLSEDITALIDRGYRYFIVNNPGHFSLFKAAKNKMPQDAKQGKKKTNDPGITLIAGPWLYIFNSWSLAFINSAGAEYLVSPLENNRQNLERTLSNEALAFRRKTFITVYSHPSLFRIRSPLGKLYDFNKFSGNKDESFRLVSSSGSAHVYPETSFYIADKIPFLQQAGFHRFILDFSMTPLKKARYKELMKAAKEAALPSGESRFNWKDGFYKSEK